MSKEKYGLFSALGEITTVIGKSANSIGKLADAAVLGAEMAVDTAKGAKASQLLDRLVEARLISESSKEALVALAISDSTKYEQVLAKVLARLSSQAEALVEEPETK